MVLATLMTSRQPSDDPWWLYYYPDEHAVPDAARRAMSRVTPEGATALYDALSAALMLPSAADRRTMAVVFSDGKDTLSWTDDGALAQLARHTRMAVYAIALDVAANGPGGRVESQLTMLRRLAEATGGRMARADSPAELRPLFAEALRDMRGRYVLAYHPDGVASEGWHAINVTLRTRRGAVRSRAGYMAVQP